MNHYPNRLFIVVLLLSLLSCNQKKKETEKEITTTEVTTQTSEAKTKKETPKPIEPGTKAPDFNLPGVDGKNYSLADFKDHETLVVLFTCNHCPTAQAYEDKFIKIVDDYKDKGVGFVAISPNADDAISLSELGYSDMSDSMEEMKLRAEQKGYNFPYLYDGETQETSLAYGPLATPHVFVFDEDRILKYSGRIDDTENPYVEPKTTNLINALDAMISGEEVPMAKTKTFGCSIKWSWKDEWAKKQREEWAKEPVALNEISLSEVGGLIKNDSDKLRLVNFWATWCGPCIMEFPELVNINRMYRDRDFEFVSVSTDKINKKEKALEVLQKKEASNINYIFSGKDIYELIEVVDKDWQGSLPYTALIAPGGEVLYKVEGTFDPPVLKKAIVEHLGRFYADND
ncbi:redoxin family protein [Galbibacter sp. EGI 63066]|uniref:redoxin family protein n=1 Tax=Galbibacter sp. EGI 63066 TaxID=2993559 RepID=UPI002249648A|nr:redoxin family protein [Galbibacter sp. EGI 63066]MCX2680081.1 redoxin family protein [Galbibacter sp. EGI 63066]